MYNINLKLTNGLLLFFIFDYSLRTIVEMMEVTFQEEGVEEETMAVVVVDSFVVEEVDIHILTIMEIEMEVVVVDVIVI